MDHGDSVIEITPNNVREIKQIPFIGRQVLKKICNINHGQMDVHLVDGTVLRLRGANPGPYAVIHIDNPQFWRMLAMSGDLGFATAYIEGLWHTDDLTAVIELGARNMDGFSADFVGSRLHRLFQHICHRFRRNSTKGSRENIISHYDLGNAFYAQWLDESMTYSSALFTPDNSCLTNAQEAKYRALAERIHLKPEQKLLEIGSGWGGFAEYAAREHDARVTSITISPSQFEYAKKRIFDSGLNEKVDIRLQDYRDLTEKYDRIASIEMFEAVGEEYWPLYFEKINKCLAPEGRAGLQIITINDDFYHAYRKGADFIQRFIFPGGMLPSQAILRQHIERAGLVLQDAYSFGRDYAQTLKLWQVRFLDAWPALLKQGFDERFRRMWQYYLSYCEAGFLAGNIDVGQFVLRR